MMHRHTMAGLGLALALGVVTGCGERRDIADLAANLAPFDELRGLNIAELRAGQARAMRRNVVRAPLEGYRERVGDWEVVYAVQGYDGSSDESWPREDVQVLEVEATQQLPSDSAAMRAWHETATRIRNETGATPHCLRVLGPGFALQVVEFDRGGDWRLAVSYAPSVRLPNRDTLSARQAVALRKFSLRQRFPQQGQPNPDSLPTWKDELEECRFP
ncbi:MAG TPA: hypothetical protein PLY94_03785 [Gemmatimonadaceae bacterium]|nr:hypothetical protein [Gemmatimonadaceae bacterium]